LTPRPSTTSTPQVVSSVGGPQGDAGVTGRKIIVDSYGGWGAHGGGAFSGKDPSKVDRSAAYAARWVAKSLVAAGLCRRVLVQVAYAIGIAAPLSINVNCYDTGLNGHDDDTLLAIVNKNFDLQALCHYQGPEALAPHLSQDCRLWPLWSQRP